MRTYLSPCWFFVRFDKKTEEEGLSWGSSSDVYWGGHTFGVSTDWWGLVGFMSRDELLIVGEGRCVLSPISVSD